LLIAGSAGAAPPERYNDPLPLPPRERLCRELEALVAEVAVAERREVPRPEARLYLATQEIARRVPASGPLPNHVVEAALRLYGLVEPPPHLIIVSMSRAGASVRDEAPPASLIDELKLQLPPALAQGRYR
jgi:hypothetical protein